MSTVKACACKGVRTCLNCEHRQGSEITAHYQDKNHKTCVYCDDCKKAWRIEADTVEEIHDHEAHKMRSDDESIGFPGVVVIKNFISEEEERDLCAEIDKTQWVDSQSGRRKQDYGPRVNFKKRKLKTSMFTGLPSFSKVLVDRMQSCQELADFFPVELCNLEYTPERGSAIEPHFDDFWIWGERLVTLTMLSKTRHRMTMDANPEVEVFIPLPRRSLSVMQGPARSQWKHGILRKDITGRRIGVSFRELAREFLSGGPSADIGEGLLKIAACYDGTAVGSSAITVTDGS